MFCIQKILCEICDKKIYTILGLYIFLCKAHHYTCSYVYITYIHNIYTRYSNSMPYINMSFRDIDTSFRTCTPVLPRFRTRHVDKFYDEPNNKGYCDFAEFARDFYLISGCSRGIVRTGHIRPSRNRYARSYF